MANKGSFVAGDDPRRHRFSAEECSRGGVKGFRSIMDNRPEVLLWLKPKIKAFYRARRKAC